MNNLILDPSIGLRSPSEFKKGTIPNSINIPILNDEEYQKVGTAYKTEGKQVAINLGNKLVSGEIKKNRIKLWIQYIKKNSSCYIFCSRGGLRSQIAYEWITEQGVLVSRLEKGYKNFRQGIINLHQSIDNYQGNWFILGGYTGSGKTKILENFEESINLESIAEHRGSAFGKTGIVQPSQANFESLITEKYLKKVSKNFLLLEDESRFIGKTKLPGKWYDKMQSSKIILLQTDIEERSNNIYNDYINHPIDNKITTEELCSYYLDALYKIRKRLGDDYYKNLKNIMNQAFKNSDRTFHLKWIKILLEKYYDRMYSYKLKLRNSQIIFKGNESNCMAYIDNLNSLNK